ncbi:MAG: hypothetical protein ACFFEY_14340 [Candidatus Thorarchaeota archaeon]
MKNKFSKEIQDEIDDLLSKIQKWKNLFEIRIEYYYDGWGIFLREKNLYPRNLIIFKSYKDNKYSIKSFEIHLKDYQKEEYKELFSNDNISNVNDLIIELKEIIYGKDLIEEASRIFNNSFAM